MTKILFIDYDGTLHDTDAKFAARLDGVYGLNSRQIMDAFLLVHRGIVHERYPEKHDDFFFHQKLLSDHLKMPYDEEEARDAAGIFNEAHEERWRNPTFFPDTFQFLDRAKENHILCLTTGDFARQKADALEKAAGKTYFSYTFDHTHLGMKGDSAFFRNALMSTNSLPAEAMVIGDSLEQDIAAASRAGIPTIWVNREALPPTITSYGPAYEARNLFEVLEYIDGFQV